MSAVEHRLRALRGEEVAAVDDDLRPDLEHAAGAVHAGDRGEHALQHAAVDQRGADLVATRARVLAPSPGAPALSHALHDRWRSYPVAPDTSGYPAIARARA
ncbi:MAG: hypothetical protein JST59_20695 [Actinobacteria bacterium]|nr:hypothetical protein [Actinomycetota bacterium]